MNTSAPRKNAFPFVEDFDWRGRTTIFQVRGLLDLGGEMCSTECQLLCKQQYIIIAIFTITILSCPHHHVSLNPLKKWTISFLTVSSLTLRSPLDMTIRFSRVYKIRIMVIITQLNITAQNTRQKVKL